MHLTKYGRREEDGADAFKIKLGLALADSREYHKNPQAAGLVSDVCLVAFRIVCIVTYLGNSL